jgi:FliI/YscN family ATPase
MKALAEQIGDIDGVEIFGRVVAVRGLMVEVAGPIHAMSVGARLTIETGGKPIPCEVVGFSGGHALAMPFAALEGVRRGCRAVVSSAAGAIRPSERWLGRVVNARAEPIDGLGPLPAGPAPYPYRASPPPAHARRRVGEPLDLGVRALNTFVTVCRGQRMGIFSGSGVGKSVLLSMLARNVSADISVIGLVGERGREVQEFLQDDLGAAGLARSVVVVSTSDEPALMRRQAAYLTLAIAEYFRDLGKDVLVLMDSVTRFAMAQREIGLSAGEPPTAKGYTPTVFVELPRLLERLPRDGAGHHHRYFQRAGGWRRSQRTRRRCGPRYPRWSYRDGACDRRARPLPGHQHPEIDFTYHAAGGGPGLSARDQSCAPGDGNLLGYGRTDPAGCLPGGLQPGGGRGYSPAFLAQLKEESTPMADGYQRLERVLRGEETQN